MTTGEAEVVCTETLHRLCRSLYQAVALVPTYRRFLWHYLSGPLSSAPNLAPNSEPVNYHFLDKAVTVYKAILSDPEKAEYIFAMDDQYGRNSPWNAGITKLQELVHKARMTDSISWCLGAMSFLLKEGYSHASDFTAVFLAGKKGEKMMV